MSKGIMGNGGLLLRNWSSRGFSLIEGNNTHSCINASSFLLTEVNWTSSLSSLPIIPIGIVVTLFLSGTVETGCILNMSRGLACEQAHLWVTTRAAKSKTIRREGVWITFLSRGFAARFRSATLVGSISAVLGWLSSLLRLCFNRNLLVGYQRLFAMHTFVNCVLLKCFIS